MKNRFKEYYSRLRKTLISNPYLATWYMDIMVREFGNGAIDTIEYAIDRRC